ncbi:unnamed protein product [Rhizopus stolonifer]
MDSNFRINYIHSRKFQKNQNIQFSEKSLKLSHPQRTMSLPLFGHLRTDKCDMDTTSNTVTFTKETGSLWPHLFEQKDQHHLLSDVNLSIHQNSPMMDTLDFDLVINGQGQKTGLE